MHWFISMQLCSSAHVPNIDSNIKCLFISGCCGQHDWSPWQRRRWGWIGDGGGGGYDPAYVSTYIYIHIFFINHMTLNLNSAMQYRYWNSNANFDSSICDMFAPGGWFNIKIASYQYRKSYYGHRMILRPSYLCSGISYTGKTASWYWTGPLSLNIW